VKEIFYVYLHIYLYSVFYASTGDWSGKKITQRLQFGVEYSRYKELLSTALYDVPQATASVRALNTDYSNNE